MKTNVAITSINTFYGVVQSIKAEQHKKILGVMRPGRNYTGQQLSRLTGYTPNVISARLFELREKLKVVERSDERIVCRYSRQSVFTHRIAGKQQSTSSKNAAYKKARSDSNQAERA